MLGVAGAALLEGAEQPILIDWGTVFELVPGAHILAVDEHGMILPKITRNFFKRPLVLLMQQFWRVVHRCIGQLKLSG